MFSLENDRQDYGRLLIPAEGYEVEMAVGTTYSLDLEALTFAAIALGLGGDTDKYESKLGSNPISMLNALRKVTDRVVLFYESGHLQIPVDSKNNKLFQLLEKITVPVALPSISQKPNSAGVGLESGTGDDTNFPTASNPANTTNYPSFHPKTWILCYRNIETKERKYRFIVMSRNLTFDRSWDVVASFEGEKTDTKQEESQPIAHFLNFLQKQTISAQVNKIVEKLRKEVAEVKFDIGDFSGVEFLPIGLKYNGYNGYDIDSDRWLCTGENASSFHHVVIVSPFISKGIIARFNNENRRLRSNSPCERTLITRLSELEKLDKESAGNFNIFTVKDEVIDGESDISEDSASPTNPSDIYQQDIHAKVLMFARREKPSYLYLGSMNASHNGFYRNIEFDVCLWCNNSLFGPSRFLEDIGLNSARSPFQQRELTEAIPTEPENKSLDIALKHICRSNARGIVIKRKIGNWDNDTNENNGSNVINDKVYKKDKDNKEQDGNINNNDLYTVELYFDSAMITSGLKMRIQPITGKYPKLPLEAVTIFTDIPLIDITEYYRIYITDPSDPEAEEYTSIIQIPLEGIPTERNRLICNRVIDSKNRLYEYISLILSDDKVQALLEYEEALGGDGKFQFNVFQTPAIYEKLLDASLHHRERFREINDIIQMLPKDSEIVTEFNKLYLIFRKALNLKDNQ